jgi:hypothetical protein
MAEKPEELTDNKSSQVSWKEFGNSGHTPIPSEQNVSLDSSPKSSTSTSSSKNNFGLVLLLGGVQPIWQLNSLFCYRGLWQDDRNKTLPANSLTSRQNVVLTIATGTSGSIQSLILQTRRQLLNYATNGKCMNLSTFKSEFIVSCISIVEVQWRRFLTQSFGKLLQTKPKWQLFQNAIMAKYLWRKAILAKTQNLDTSHRQCRSSALSPSRLFKPSNKSTGSE